MKDTMLPLRPDGTRYTMEEYSKSLGVYGVTLKEETTADKIGRKCDDLKELLIAKNKSYGDSATKPQRFFGTSTALEGLCTRIDDKLNRICNGEGFPGDDDVTDLLGYLILYKIAQEDSDA